MKYNAVIFDWSETIAHQHKLLFFIPKLFGELYHSGYRLGVLSNSNRYGDAHWLRKQLEEAKLTRFIECIMGTGAVIGNISGKGGDGVHKPQPEAFQRVLDFMNIPADKAVYVGDSYKNDIQGSAVLGMAGLLVNAGGKRWDNELWKLLNDVPQKRLNILTSFTFQHNQSGTFITTKVRHLTRVPSIGDKIIAGLKEYKILGYTVVGKDSLKLTQSSILSGTANRNDVILEVVY